MINLLPHELPFEFHAFTDPSQLVDKDLTFSWYVVWTDEFVQGMCNDIPCSMCPFQPECKDGQHKGETLTTYAKEHFPELQI